MLFKHMEEVCANFNHSSSQSNVAIQPKDEINLKLKKKLYLRNFLYCLENNHFWAVSLRVILKFFSITFTFLVGNNSIAFNIAASPYD